ncbi:MAG: tetratricopeptide repeat protein [Planctomycetales bacterium]|nr:tetratricopeptide repeat protein [Planctomycetales bacterium]MBN8627673.1 tetratricopeptide repeat protein [Planctomycetota bacterium]
MSSDDKPGRQPLAPAVRARLQKLFEHGTKTAGTGNFDYAHEMYTQCVVGDPSNPIYVKALLANLSKKYGNSKKGSKLAGLKLVGAKASIMKSSKMKKWDDLLKTGLDALKENPWDAGILTELARSCEAQEFDEAEIEYLRQAVDADDQDPEANRLLGRAYDRVGDYPEAIKAFSRVVKALPKDEEGIKALSHLAVKKTIVKGGYEGATSSKDVRQNKFGQAAEDDATALSPEEKLMRAIEKDPADPNAYIELNDMYLKDEHYDKSVAIMTKALDATGGGNIMIRERLEDAQLRLARQHTQISEEKAKRERTPEAVELYNKMRVELNNKEIEIYGKRCDRYPTNLGFKYELALRLQKSGKYPDAIKLFQEARADSKRRGQVYLALGNCFSAIKQYRLALQNFEAAVNDISERDADNFKMAIYNSARIAEHLKEWETAEKHYNHLASFDFGYKDVAERLDKIGRIRENGGDPDVS